MTRVLVADTDPLLVSAVMRGLERVGLEVSGTTSEAELGRRLRGESFDLVIVDSRFAGLQVRALGLARVVLMVSFLGEPAERTLSRHFGLLRKPFTSVELSCVIKEELGWIASRPASLVDLLARAHRNASNVSIDVRSGLCLGRISVEHGEVVHATSGQLEGEAALLELLARSSEVRERAPERGGVRTVHREFRELLLGLLGEIEQEEHGVSKDDPASRTRRITRALRRTP